MRSRGLKITVVCLLAAVFCPGLWGADLNVNGNVNVLGDGSRKIPGNLTVNGTLVVNGTLAASFNAFDAVPGNKIDLGAWDFCFLSKVQLQREAGQCLVESTQVHLVTKRSRWQLSADDANCSATCLSFNPNPTAN